MTRSWAFGIAPAGFDVECSGEIHPLLWRDGELRAPAHPDPEAERALAGLGAEPCRCVELLDAWAACARDPRVLMVGPRGSDAIPAWPDSPSRRARLARSGRLAAGSRTGLTARPGPAPAVDPLNAVMALGDQLPRRLVATVAHALADQLDNRTLFPMLHMAVYSRVRTTVHRWQRRTPPEVVLELISADAERSLTGSPDAGMLARLPLAWLSEVWAPDLDIVAGRFTLAAQPAATPDAGDWRLLTVDSAMRVHIDRFTAG